MGKEKANNKLIFGFVLSFFISLVSCVNTHDNSIVKVVLEDGDFSCANKIVEGKRGDDFTFFIYIAENREVTSSTYPNYSIQEVLDGSLKEEKITFHNVYYSTMISLSIGEISNITYHDGYEGKVVTSSVVYNHLRKNITNNAYIFAKDGSYLIGFEDEEGGFHEFGSRVDKKTDTLTAVWVKPTDPSFFTYAKDSMGYIRITGCSYTGDELTIPDEIDGSKVISINGTLVKDAHLKKLILPPSLYQIGEKAFVNCQFDELYFYDSLYSVNEDSFYDCTVKTMHLNANSEPRYSGTYFDSWSDKFDRLCSIKDKKKIILVAGSSARFGYNSEIIDNEFPEYDVVNMGVYAYSSPLCQLDVISNYIKDGDLLITSPEFDTLETQMELPKTIGYEFFAMCEANYNILTLLDLTKYDDVFASFSEFASYRSHMDSKSYDISVNQYDEDGNKTSSSTYNKYGDYILYRENNHERKNFGIRRAFFNKKYFSDEMLDSFEKGYSVISEKGAKVLYFYSPRMSTSLSEDSSDESVKELGEYLETNIDMPFLNTINDCLLDPLYFYGTDNHLSTDGANIRSKEFVKSLKTYLKEYGND